MVHDALCLVHKILALIALASSECYAAGINISMDVGESSDQNLVNSGLDVT